MKEYKKRVKRISKYVLNELEIAKSNNITIDIGKYFNKRELKYVNSLGLFKEVKNEIDCMIRFII